MLFSKKKVDEEIEEEVEEVGKASDRIQFAQFKGDDDKYALSLVRNIRDGVPIIINFERVDETVANKYIAFFIGALAVLDSRPVVINDNTYLFSKKENFFDGSLREFIDNIPKN
jgi:cell division inhibitor SepF